mmetsp:Transcript_15437/g.33296  ORF Transcript_15437/g.33296 Transcript_15437/m.33296 type:complete len:85 (+) Transcript_15437:295-549(+)
MQLSGTGVVASRTRLDQNEGAKKQAMDTHPWYHSNNATKTTYADCNVELNRFRFEYESIRFDSIIIHHRISIILSNERRNKALM